jgi:hypothetical protein
VSPKWCPHLVLAFEIVSWCALKWYVTSQKYKKSEVLVLEVQYGKRLGDEQVIVFLPWKRI